MVRTEDLIASREGSLAIKTSYMLVKSLLALVRSSACSRKETTLPLRLASSTGRMMLFPSLCGEISTSSPHPMVSCSWEEYSDRLLKRRTADPVFFLHHTQLDRMWWEWQHRSPERFWAYHGNTVSGGDGVERKWSSNDTLDVGSLEPTVKVADIMDTESQILCYRY